MTKEYSVGRALVHSVLHAAKNDFTVLNMASNTTSYAKSWML